MASHRHRVIYYLVTELHSKLGPYLSYDDAECDAARIDGCRIEAEFVDNDDPLFNSTESKG